jgi:hypothetical protein
MKSQFTSHGKSRLEHAGHILRLYVEGPWNAELVVETHQMLREYLEQNQITNWGLMVIVTGSALSSPAALEAIRVAAANETKRFDRKVTAWVLAPTLEGRSIMARFIPEVYNEINMVQVFESEELAEQWLKTVL